MNAPATRLQATPENYQRIELEARIVRRLQRIDADLLRQLDDVTRQAETISRSRAERAPAQDFLHRVQRTEASPAAPAQTGDDKPDLTRRQALLRLAAGGTALTAAGALAVRSRGQAPTIAERAQHAQLQMLLDLYEMLDRVELDRLIATALVVVGAALGGLRSAARGVQTAVDFVGELLDRFEAAAPQIAAGIDAVEDVVQVLADQVDRLRDLFADALGEAEPLTHTVDRFVQTILSYLPFGIGDRIRQTVEEMGALVALVPNGVRVVRYQLLAPMRTWFPTANETAEEDVRTALFTTTRQELLQPARTLLDDVIGFADRWETELAGPLEQALAQRAEIRQQIQAYKQRNDLT